MLKVIDVYNDTMVQFMYELLLERYEVNHINIPGETHGVSVDQDTPPTPPTYEEHIKYIRGDRYKHLYYWEVMKIPVGIVFLTKDNEIGVFVKNEYQDVGYGGKMLLAIIKKHPDLTMIARINPKNQKIIKIVLKLGFVQTCAIFVRINENDQNSTKSL